MGLYPSPRLLPAGDGAVSVELGDEISREANARALTLERLLLDARVAGLVDTVPSFRSLLVQYDPRVLPWAALRARLLELARRLADAPPPPGRRVELPCAYGGVHAMAGNPTGCMGLQDHLGRDWKARDGEGDRVINVPGCPSSPTT